MRDIAKTALILFLARRLVVCQLLVLALAGHCSGQSIDLPEKIEAKTGRLATVTIKTTAKTTEWLIVPSDNIDAASTKTRGNGD